MEVKPDAALLNESQPWVGAAIIGEKVKLSSELSEISKTSKQLIDQIEKDRLRLLAEQKKKANAEKFRIAKLEQEERQRYDARLEEMNRRALREQEVRLKNLRKWGRYKRDPDFAVPKAQLSTQYHRACLIGESNSSRKPRSYMQLKRLSGTEMDQMMMRSSRQPKPDRSWWLLEETRRRQAESAAQASAWQG